MLCPASCLPLLRELAQWRCLLGWHRHHGVASSGAAALTATAHHTQGSEFRDRPQRPVGRTEPLLGSQVSPAFYFVFVLMVTVLCFCVSVIDVYCCCVSVLSMSTIVGVYRLHLLMYSLCMTLFTVVYIFVLFVAIHLLLTSFVYLLLLTPSLHTHKSITTLQGEDVVFLASNIGVRGAVDWLMLQSCFSENFLLVLEKQQHLEGHQQFFAVVLLIGTREQADAFAYRLQLSGRHRRRLTWEAAPRSIHDGVAAAILDGDCLVFDSTVAQLFADDGNLGINVTISMC
uniref:E3 ubiquitin-protein ligase n=1 Tax=Salarias fasciatus TaxID=181472 RepID=A0A672HBB0_SALFA